ncbi:unnamed protein product [Caenorhabditis sp. 36 PRJEB53466]|nr:unnamed protein product [Caenorhabditis sp. 36 PRJEB53466]
MSEPENGPKRPTQPFLRKGQGTARFGMQNSSRNAPGAGAAQSPMIQLPRFTPTSSIPFSARTVDSGISNEDETRPPTTASLPMDRPFGEPQNRTPTVLEEEEEKGEEEGEEEEDEGHGGEEEQVRPETFIPDSMISTEPCSEASADALRYRQIAEKMHQQAHHIQTLASVSSASPASYASSDLSGPLGASTPIHLLQDPNNQSLTRRDPPTHQNQPLPFQSMSSTSLETPQARPFASNRVNLMAQHEAQTGMSLIENRRRHVPRHQKENFQQFEHLPPLSEHVYDQPMPHMPPSQPPAQNRAVRNLMIQLRDAIAHVDFAEEQVRKSGRQLHEQYQKKTASMAAEYERKTKESEEEWRRRMEVLEEERQTETERIKRERREIERDRKLLEKGKGERQREQTKMIEELRKKYETAETQLAKLRIDVRNRDDRLKKKEEELEKVATECEKNKKRVRILDKQVRQLRQAKERAEREEQMFARAAINRTGPLQPYPIGTRTARPPPQTAQRAPEVIRRRSVSWADEPEEDELSLGCIEPEGPGPQLPAMKPSERTKSQWGPCTVYRDQLGEATKVTKTAENGTLVEYANGNVRWMNAAGAVQWYRFVDDGTIKIELVAAKISIVCFPNRQLEVKRPADNVTVISQNRAEIRTELMHHGSGYRYVETFNRNGEVVARDFCGPDVIKKYTAGVPTSFRNGESRRVDVFAFDDFELVEPEFRLRWYKGEAVVVKALGRPMTGEKVIRMEFSPKNGTGTMEAVENEVIDNKVVKTKIMQW